MAIGLRFAARSHIGLGRYKNNQDSGYAGPYLLAVADGMGGAAGGDVASATVVRALAPLDSDPSAEPDTGPAAQGPARDLAEAIAAANKAMGERVKAQAALDGMGSTCTTLRRVGPQLVLAHVGDSRGYVLADGDLRQVTHDHTFVQRLVDTGQITEEEAERHPQRSVILRVVGHLEDTGDIDTATFDAVAGQRWLLCSDGLPRVVSADTIRDTLAADAAPTDAADRLVELALRAGGPDNITVIVADVVEEGGNPPPPQIVGAAALADGHNASHPEHTAALPASAAPASQRSPESDTDAPATDALAGDAPEEEDDESHRPRWIGNALVGLVILAVLAASLVGLRTWFRTQYFVGIDNETVAIFRGWNEPLGPLNQPTLHRRTALPVDTLPAVNRERLGGGMDPDSLAAAQRTVSQLWKSSSLCTDTTSGTTPDGGGDTGATQNPATTQGPAATLDSSDALAPTPGVPGMPTPAATAPFPAPTQDPPITPIPVSPAPGATALENAASSDGAAGEPPARPVECDQ